MKEPIKTNTTSAMQYLGISRYAMATLIKYGAFAGATQIDKKGHWAIPIEALKAFKAHPKTIKQLKTERKQAELAALLSDSGPKLSNSRGQKLAELKKLLEEIIAKEEGQ